MLLGQYEANLTDKGRLALPKRFREQLGSKVIVARWYEGCLVVVSEAKWEKLLHRLTAEKQFITKSVRDTDRFILGSAYEIFLDKQGRFVLPKNLRLYANINNDAVFLGLDDRVEIWNKSEWMKKEKLIQDSAESAIEELAKNG